MSPENSPRIRALRMLMMMDAVVLAGLGYALAAVDPRQNALSVQMGIARGLLEVAFGAACVARGVVTWKQGGFRIIVAKIGGQTRSISDFVDFRQVQGALCRPAVCGTLHPRAILCSPVARDSIGLSVLLAR